MDPQVSQPHRIEYSRCTRDPAQCIASACSLYYTLLAMIAEESTIDKHALGAAVMDYTKLSLEAALDTIAKNPSMNVVHVRY